MRIAPFGAFFLFAFLAAAAAASDPLSDAAAVQPGVPHTPSGVGDPNAIVCRAPQPLSGGGLGPKSCMHNSVWARLTETGKDLAPDAKSVFDRPTVDSPKGEGNPDAITCRKPQMLASAWHIRSYGPKVCLTNGYWASLKASHKRVADDGSSLITTNIAQGPIAPFGSPGLSMIPAQVVH